MPNQETIPVLSLVNIEVQCVGFVPIETATTAIAANYPFHLDKPKRHVKYPASIWRLCPTNPFQPGMKNFTHSTPYRLVPQSTFGKSCQSLNPKPPMHSQDGPREADSLYHH